MVEVVVGLSFSYITHPDCLRSTSMPGGTGQWFYILGAETGKLQGGMRLGVAPSFVTTANADLRDAKLSASSLHDAGLCQLRINPGGNRETAERWSDEETLGLAVHGNIVVEVH